MAKIMMGDYDHIRSILRDTYIYGCFTRYDFEDMGRNGHTYEKQKSKITAFIPKKFINKRKKSKRHIISCKYNTQDLKENYFAETFRYCNYNEGEITVFFNLLALLYQDGEVYLSDFIKRITRETDVLDEQFIRKKIAEVIEAGYIEKEVNKHNETIYTLKENILTKFEDDEIVSIYQMLDLYSGVSPFEMPYYFVKEKIKKYLKVDKEGENEKLYNILKDSNFLFKNNHVFNLIDNDVLYRIMKAIKNQYILKINHGEINTKVTKNRVKETSTEIIPVKILHECTYGRQYLIGYKVLDKEINTDEKTGENTVRFKVNKEIKIFRIDKIKELEILDPYDKEKKILKYKYIKNRLKTGYIDLLDSLLNLLKSNKEKEKLIKDINKLKRKFDLLNEEDFMSEVKKYEEFFRTESEINKNVAMEVDEYKRILKEIEDNKYIIEKAKEYSELLEKIKENTEIKKELKENKELFDEIEEYKEKKIKSLIDKVVELEIIENRTLNYYLEEAKKESKKEENCWTAGAINNELGKIKIKFIFDDTNESNITKRLKNECRKGYLEKYYEDDKKGYYIYESEVTTATEMIPWIRSFGDAAIVLESDEINIFTNDKVEDRIKSNWNNLLKMYESGKCEEILKKYNKYKKKINDVKEI